MRRSKIEAHIAILQTLADSRKLITTHISYNTYLNSSSVNKCLCSLLACNLVQELNEKRKRKTYAITEKGINVLEIARKIDNSLHVFNVS